MQSEFQSEENQTPPALETEPDAKAVHNIYERLNAITTYDKRADTQRRALLAIGCVILAVGLLAAEFTPAHLAHWKAWIFILVCGTGLATMIASGLHETWRRKKSYPEDVARLGGTRVIPTLFIFLQRPLSVSERNEAHEALIVLLPQLKSGDACNLTPLIRDTMRYWIQGVVNPELSGRVKRDLIIATLKAFGQVGDTADLPDMEALANMEARDSDYGKIKQAALTCLPMLQARCRELEALRTRLGAR